MCGRFYIDTDDTPDELIELLNRAEVKAQRLQPGLSLPRGEVRPGDPAAVIALSRTQERSVFPMRWGFGGGKRLLINARSETAAQKPTFRHSMQDRRCLIPASAYFEWDHRAKPLQKYQFHLASSPILYLAGLYRFEADQRLPVFTILTREAAPDIACFHDRMPIILPRHAADDWLNRSLPPDPLMQQAVTQLVWQPA